MIESKKDYISYLEEDRKALGRSESRPRLFGDEIWKFERALRGLEYYTNCEHAHFGRLWRMIYQLQVHYLSLECGFSIPCNVFGPGLAIVHRGTIVVNSRARIGSGCRIHVSVNIGASGGVKDNVPVIGNNVCIEPGAKIFGKIQIADNIIIGANAVVNKSFLEPGVGIAGVPAKVIGKRAAAGDLDG